MMGKKKKTKKVGGGLFEIMSPGLPKDSSLLNTIFGVFIAYQMFDFAKLYSNIRSDLQNFVANDPVQGIAIGILYTVVPFVFVLVCAWVKQYIDFVWFWNYETTMPFEVRKLTLGGSSIRGIIYTLLPIIIINVFGILWVLGLAIILGRNQFGEQAVRMVQVALGGSNFWVLGLFIYQYISPGLMPFRKKKG